MLSSDAALTDETSGSKSFACADSHPSVARVPHLTHRLNSSVRQKSIVQRFVASRAQPSSLPQRVLEWAQELKQGVGNLGILGGGDAE